MNSGVKTMNVNELPAHLSEQSTLWTVVLRAHHGPTDEQVTARRLLVEHYGGAVKRHLNQVLRDPEAVSELYQEVALRIMNGAFHRVDPARGRFRDYLKVTILHLIARYRREQRNRPRLLSPDDPEPASELPSLPDTERQFLDSWRDELLSRAWMRLAEAERQTGRPLHTVLYFRAEHPDLRSPQMAEQLSARLGRPLTADAVRQALHRAREMFADLLLDEVAQTLAAPKAEQLEEEVLTLGLHSYCQSALRRWAGV
jgi:RNA polymerase sigma-70 factor (ECF subfamily)